MPNLIWLKNDLRIHDNILIEKAMQAEEPCLFLFVWDLQWSEPMPKYGFQKMGALRARFLLESIQDLSQSLEKLGTSLLFKVGQAEEIIPSIVEVYGIQSVIASEEINTEEMQLLEKVDLALPVSCNLELHWNNTLFHKDDIPFGKQDLPMVFTAFRKACEKRSRVRPLCQEPKELRPFTAASANPTATHLLVSDSWPDLASIYGPFPEEDERSAFPWEGGESNGLARVRDYIWQTEHLATYKKTRNGLIGTEYSSKLSTWLANGSLSARYVATEINRFEREVTKNQSTYWLLFELIWRDFFQFTAWKYGDQLFYESSLRGDIPHRWGYAERDFEKWRIGATREAFVNANMKELLATGWMSNRGRQNVASYLIHDLGIDWRWGAAWFESQLLDYDPSSNWGNWAYIAGVGNDPRPMRKFNIERQQGMYDAKGAYRELWSE